MATWIAHQNQNIVTKLFHLWYLYLQIKLSSGRRLTAFSLSLWGGHVIRHAVTWHPGCIITTTKHLFQLSESDTF